jgi:hypothetical protein
MVRSALPEHEHHHTVAKTTFSVGGLVLLVVAGMGIYWLWPEIQRYLKIERM